MIHTEKKGKLKIGKSKVIPFFINNTIKQNDGILNVIIKKNKKHFKSGKYA